jgi:hypothetical protein
MSRGSSKSKVVVGPAQVRDLDPERRPVGREHPPGKLHRAEALVEEVRSRQAASLGLAALTPEK